MNVVIWGLGTNGKNFIDVWGEQNVVAIVESNMAIRNTGEYKGIPIIDCEEYYMEYREYEIVITPMFSESIMKWLNENKITNYFILGSSRVRLETIKAINEGKLDSLLGVGNNRVYGLADADLFSRYLYEYLTKIKKEKCLLNDKNATSTCCISLDSKKRRKRDIDYEDINKFVHIERNKDLKQYFNKHEGKRIFIVATGPSITLEDLDVLRAHNEICISMNGMFYLYDRTRWRPDYYVMSDGGAIREYEKHMQKIDHDNVEVFVSDNYLNVSNELKCHMFRQKQCTSEIGFSNDFSNVVYSGATVVYACLQLAVYMGAKQIYLLGCDFSFSSNLGAKENHCCGPANPTYTFNFEFVKKAYECAKRETEKMGVKIYNATRGGKLEVFDRVNFDSLF